MARNLRRWTALLTLLSSLPAVGQFRKSAGAAIDEATHDSAKQTSPQTAEKSSTVGAATVLTDTKGFDVHWYLEGVTQRVRDDWYGAIRELVAKADERQGAVVVRFTIVRSGEIQDVHVINSSGEQDLDEAACQGLWRVSPVAPLPKSLVPDKLELNLHFFYKGKKPSRWWKTR
jgi:TonB family protein